MITSASRSGGGQFAAGVTAAVFTTLAIIAIVWGAAHVVVGVPLRRQRPWSRLMALMLGSVDLLLLPCGTALGLYALWVLLNEEGKKLVFIELMAEWLMAEIVIATERHGSVASSHDGRPRVRSVAIRFERALPRRRATTPSRAITVFRVAAAASA